MEEIDKYYFEDLNRIKNTINENRNKAMVIVNNAMILTYYQIGVIINERKSWGNKYIQRLAIDLKEYGKGYSYNQLKKMSQFANTFASDEIGPQAVVQIAWGTINVIMNKSSSKEEMLWYINQTHRNRWSRSTVLRQFELQAYQRNMIEPLTTNETSIDDMIKDTLNVYFISKKDVKSEKDLKNKLVENIILFLQELGQGFSLVGKEYKLTTPSNRHFYIDLLMYHIKSHAYVVIEVKLGEIAPSDLGQLNFYVNAVDDLEKGEGDSSTVGILLCKSADKYVVETSMKGLKTSIGISKYKLLEDLPNYLSSRLNALE